MTARVLVLSGVLAGWPHTLVASDAPIVTLAYSGLLDEACADVGKQQFDSRAVEELSMLLPEVEQQWQSEGLAWLTTASDVVGRHSPFMKQRPRSSPAGCHP
jgi:hypothetical protein